MIELSQIQKTYWHNGEKINSLKNINLIIKKGEILGVMGKSGAGKSTLIRCINLLEKPTHGQVFIDQTDLMQLSISKLRRMRRRMSMIFQSFNLLNNLNVYHNIALPVKFNKNKAHENILSLLTLVGLLDKKNLYPAQLSGGQKQRVAIARALVTSPAVLLCDEPTSALDAETADDILKLLRQIHDKLPLTIVLISHQMNLVKKICDRIVTLDNGHIVNDELCLDH